MASSVIRFKANWSLLNGCFRCDSSSLLITIISLINSNLRMIMNHRWVNEMILTNYNYAHCTSHITIEICFSLLAPHSIEWKQTEIIWLAISLRLRVIDGSLGAARVWQLFLSLLSWDNFSESQLHSNKFNCISISEITIILFKIILLIYFYLQKICYYKVKIFFSVFWIYFYLFSNLLHNDGYIIYDMIFSL